MIKKIVPHSFLTAILLFASSTLLRAEVVEEVIVRVNSGIVVLSEYNLRLAELRQQLGQQLTGAALDEEIAKQTKDALRDLIDEQLLLQKASELGINPETDLVRRLDSIRQQLNLPSMEALEKAVAEQGLNYEDFRQNLRENILTQQVIGREMGGRVAVSPDEIKVYYEEHKQEFERKDGVRVQQIVISTEGKEGEEATKLRAKADDMLARARNGEDFAELARQNSDDESTASAGGEVGFVERGLMAPEIEQVVFALEKDKISDVIPIKAGFLIVKLLERTSAGIPPLTEVEARVHEQIYYSRLQPALRQYLGQLRLESYILIKPGYEDTGAIPEPAATPKS